MKSPLPPNIDAIQSFGKTFMQGITSSSAEQKAIEEVTRRQAASKRWAEEINCIKFWESIDAQVQPRQVST